MIVIRGYLNKMGTFVCWYVALKYLLLAPVEPWNEYDEGRRHDRHSLRTGVLQVPRRLG